MFPATDLDNHLVEVPARTGARTAAAKIDGDQSAEFQEPASYGLVRYINATFGQQVLDITKRQGEPSVKPDRVLDNLRRKPMSLEGYLDHPETVAAPDRFGHRLNVSMPSPFHPAPFGEDLQVGISCPLGVGGKGTLGYFQMSPDPFE